MCRLAGSSQAVLSSAVREEESSCTAQHLPTAVSRLPTWQMPQMLLLLLFSNMLASCEMLLFFQLFTFDYWYDLFAQAFPCIVPSHSLGILWRPTYFYWPLFSFAPAQLFCPFLKPPHHRQRFLLAPAMSPLPYSCHWQGLFSVRGVSKHKHDPPEAVCFWLFRIPWQQIRGLGFFVPLMCCS